LGPSSTAVSELTAGFSSLRRELSDLGFNLFSLLEGRVVGDDWIDGGVLLIGNAGPKLWQKLPSEWLERDNPIDEYTSHTTRQLLARHVGGIGPAMLFPDNASGRDLPSLQQLGLLAGWHHDSPLGMGIHVEHGVWFAYRAVFYLPLVASLAPSVGERSAPSPIGSRSPCIDCVDTPCVYSCPARALSATAPPNMGRCADFRLIADSPCDSTCKARLACPVASQWRYSTEQIAYHYDRSRQSIRQWMDQL